MTRLNWITHPHPLVEEKVNYFSDYYAYVVNNLGRISECEIENLSTLTAKILFQLENNQAEKVKPYILNYLSHPLVQKNNAHFKEQYHYDLINKTFLNLRRMLSKGNWQPELTNRKNEFILDLKRFRTYLRKYLLKKSLKEVISYLKCSHELTEHQDDIEHHTRVIAIELFNSRRGKADLNSIFERIMSDNSNEFTFCPAFVKKNKDNLKKAKVEFIEKRTFEEQFEGILNFKKTKKSSYFYVFRIGNVLIQDETKIKIDDVTFYSLDHDKIQNLKAVMKDRFLSKEFIEEHYGMYAIIQCSTNNEQDTHKVLVKKVQKLVDQINIETNSNAYVDRVSYLRTQDFKDISGKVRMGNPINLVSRRDIKGIPSFNIYSYLSSKKSPAKEEFLSYEESYMEARKRNDLSLYWKYLENLLGKPVQSKLIKLVTKALLEDEKFKMRIYLLNTIGAYNLNGSILDLKGAELIKLTNEMMKEDFDFGRLRDLTSNEFVLKVVKNFEDLNSAVVERYLSSLLWELYEYRNFDIHSGNYNSLSKLKLELSIPRIIHLMRHVLVEKIISKPRLTLKELIKE